MPLFILVSGMAASVVAGMRASVCSHTACLSHKQTPTFHKQLLPRRFLYWKCAFPALELSFPYKETTVPQAGNWYLTYMIGVT